MDNIRRTRRRTICHRRTLTEGEVEETRQTPGDSPKLSVMNTWGPRQETDRKDHALEGLRARTQHQWTTTLTHTPQVSRNFSRLKELPLVWRVSCV